MFRAQTNAFDDVVLKATDENLTSENWEYILVRRTRTHASGARIHAVGGLYLYLVKCSNFQGASSIIPMLTSSRRMYATRWAPPILAPKMPSLR